MKKSFVAALCVATLSLAACGEGRQNRGYDLDAQVALAAFDEEARAHIGRELREVAVEAGCFYSLYGLDMVMYLAQEASGRTVVFRASLDFGTSDGPFIFSTLAQWEVSLLRQQWVADAGCSDPVVS